MLSQLFCPHCHVFCTPLAFGFRVSFSFLFLLILFFFFDPKLGGMEMDQDNKKYLA